MHYRPDINGLRAYAVLAVLLYHFGIPPFSGGFIGVDLFFVISGFLMTAIIFGGLEQGRFSLGRFYLSRARRIIPALAVLCLTLLIFGWFWLAPSDYNRLGEHIETALSFASNFTFHDEAGYFDAPSKSKWLLHTWSLSVEWQFYLLFPLLLMLVTRLFGLRKKGGFVVLLLGMVLSLAHCIEVTPRNGSYAFFLLPPRAWELFCGGLVYLSQDWIRPHRRLASGFEWAGLIAVAISTMAYSQRLDWPGYFALLPVVGGVLILAARQEDSLLTSNCWTTAIGNWSYSIYLWHWPIVVGLNYFGVHNPTAITIGFMTSILLGALSFKLVEQPSRRYLNSPRQIAVALTALLFPAMSIAGMVILGNGLSKRVPEAVRIIDNEAHNRLPEFTPPCGFNRKTGQLTPCILGNSEDIGWVVLGDSHALSIVSAVQQASRRGVMLYSHQCATLFDTELVSKGKNNHCTRFHQEVIKQISKLPTTVGLIVVNRYSMHLKGPNEGTSGRWGIRYSNMTPEEQKASSYQRYSLRLKSTLCTFTRDRNVYTLGPIPEMGISVPKVMARNALLDDDLSDVTLPLSDYLKRNDVAVTALKKAEKACGTTFLDPRPYLCDDRFCYGSHNKRPLYFDDDHLSEWGNQQLLPLFNLLINDREKVMQ